MKRVAVTVMATVATVFAFIAPASASATRVHPTHTAISRVRTSANYFELCNAPYPSGLCLRDPSDGGSGTEIKMDPFGQTNSFLWTRVHDSNACGGTGVVEPNCGLPESVVDRYLGDDVVYFQQYSSGNCIKFSLDTGWYGYMGTCGDTNTLFILGSCSNYYCYYPTFAASEYFGTTEWMCGNITDQPPYAGTDCGSNASTWGEVGI